jgi:2-succinyl-5-enolpyruvyl-6-hydroxy-3-cyclohexene-1-carboxylate synthase
MADQVTQQFAATFVDELARSGIRTACLAPGSRSAPLAMALARHPAIRVIVHIDERCASFFALGMARAGEHPVALLCTSGTAATEFHAAVVEASQSRVPLLVLTADRPPELREVGANQVIDQARLYGSAVRWYQDPGPPEPPADGGRAWRRLAARAVAETMSSPPGPVHLNLPLREPLVAPAGVVPEPLEVSVSSLWVARSRPEPGADTIERLASMLGAARRPLLVAGELGRRTHLGALTDELALAAGMPVLAEPSSHLRRESGVGVVEAYDALLRAPLWAQRHQPDLVLRVGATPTSKVLNQFLARSEAPVVVIDPDGGWRDPDLLGAGFLRCDEEALFARTATALAGRGDGEWMESWVRAGQAAGNALGGALAMSTLHEGHVVRALADELPEHAVVLVGSSMPIRDVDTFWPPASTGTRFLGNRGASGIDGLVSTGLGAAAAGEWPAALLIGDLSLYHDMNGLWAIRRHGLAPLLVVLDNDGGGIFQFLPPAQHPDVFEELFGTPLGLRLEDVARLYGLNHVAVEEAAGLPGALHDGLAGKPAMICARFDRAQSVRGHAACWEAVRAAVE